jgi:hypothetical protein
MAFNLIQLNSYTQKENFVDDCNFGDEKTNGTEVLELNSLKQRVKNYKDVMLHDYGVEPSKFSQTIPVNIESILTLIARNWKDLAGVRIYLSKKTRDKRNNDYELILVPCTEEVDNGRKYFKDKLSLTLSDSHIFVSDCRRPPDCNTKGAGLI